MFVAMAFQDKKTNILEENKEKLNSYKNIK